MPQYYFDISDSRASTTDDEGVDFPDEDAACAAATVAAAAMLQSLMRCAATELSVTVRDEQGQRVCDVTAKVRVTKRAQ